jgi:hypothetical protein
MKLDGASFAVLRDALLDAFGSLDDLESVARCLNTTVAEITPDAKLSIVVGAFVEYAESRDQVEDLLRCAKSMRPKNQALAALRVRAFDAGGAVAGTGTVVALLDTPVVPQFEQVSAEEFSEFIGTGLMSVVTAFFDHVQIAIDLGSSDSVTVGDYFAVIEREDVVRDVTGDVLGSVIKDVRLTCKPR